MDTLIAIIILIISVIIHEVAHGYMAYWLGDPTAKLSGRLTLNPVPHIDPIGSILLPLLLVITKAGFVVGWAKPVPYNPYNLRAGKWGPAYVALAGPASNLIIAAIFSVLIRTGSAVWLGSAGPMLAAQIVFINLLLAFFNLVPVPPLDGSKVLFAALPYRYREIENFLNRYQLIFLLILIFFVWGHVAKFIYYVFALLTGLA